MCPTPFTTNAQTFLGTPTGFARFPGTYKMDDPGKSLPRSLLSTMIVTESERAVQAYGFPVP